MSVDAEDIAALREEGFLKQYLLSLTGRPLAKPEPTKTESEPSKFHIPRPGAWPCGTAASGPTPPPCNHQPTEGAA